MFQSSYYKNRNGKRFGPYQLLRVSTGYGKHVSLHIRKGLSPMETIMLHPSRAADFFEKEKEWKYRKLASSPHPEKKIFAGQGRSLIPKPVAEIIKAAGWNMQGRRVMKSKDRFFSLDAARIRYSLGDEKFRAQIGSPERLLELCLQARSKLKSANALRLKKVTFDSCLAEAISEQTAS